MWLVHDAVVAVGNLLREVVPILFETVTGVQVGILGTVGDSGEVADAEVDARCLVTGSGGCLNFVLTDEVEFPPLFRLVVDGPNLLKILDGDAGGSFVFNKDVFPRSGVFLVIRALRESHSIVLGVVADAVLLPRHRATRMFFVDTTTLVVVVVAFAVARRIHPVVGLPLFVPRVEGFSEFLQNALTGLRM